MSENKTEAVPFSDEQLKIIGNAFISFLENDTVIIDKDGKTQDEMTVYLRNDAQGIRYYLGLEDDKPDYINPQK